MSTPENQELVAVPLADLQSLIAAATQRYMTIGTATAYSDLSEESIRRMISTGVLTAYRPRRGRILIDKRELDAAILSSTKKLRKGRGIRSKK